MSDTLSSPHPPMTIRTVCFEEEGWARSLAGPVLCVERRGEMMGEDRVGLGVSGSLIGRMGEEGRDETME